MNPDKIWDVVIMGFNPWQPTLDPSQPTLEESAVRKWYVERYDQPLLPLMRDLLASRAYPLKAIVTGHRGSGKSWALANLALNPEIAQRFLVVWLDVERSADIFNVNHVEVLFLMGVAAFKAARNTGLKPDRKYLEALVDSLTTLVRQETRDEQFGIDLDQVLDSVFAIGLGAAAAVAGPVGAAVAGAAAVFGKLFTLGLSSETVRRMEVRPRVTEILTRLNELIAHLQQVASRPLLLLVDGLDKIELEQARTVFAESRILQEPICSVVYTAPILLYYSPDLASARQLFATYEFPNVHLFYREDRNRRDEQGYAFLRAVVRTRLQKLGLDPDARIEPAALDALVAMSGGVVRELVHLMHDAALRAQINGETRIGEATARQAIYRLRRQYSAGLSLPYLEELRKVHELGRPTGTDICDKLLQNLYVLSYANDALWYAVHPNVLPLLEGV
ncbi:MAG: hypothetical protein N2508_05550 [Anaerolineae bacterium]|nr:hypothetical protein [Anaerolineae bacterium]